MAQIVISNELNNKVLAHGEDCFMIYCENKVICNNTGTTFENATIAECDSLPADIDSVDYEYHAGEFIKCIPTAAIEELPYTGKGSSTLTLTFSKLPKVIYLSSADYTATLFIASGCGYYISNSWSLAQANGLVVPLTVTTSGTTVTIKSANGNLLGHNTNNAAYVAIGLN